MTAANGVVRLANNGDTWTGIMIDPSGLIVTTTSNLGRSPAVQFTTAQGTTGQAWIVGRDDDSNIALFRVVNPQGEFAVVERGDVSVPRVGKELATIQYTRGARTPIINETSVVGSQQSTFIYFQLQARHQSGDEGGAVVDEFGRLRGMRMEPQFISDLGIGQTSQSYAMAASDLFNAVPRITGEVNISADVRQCAGSGAASIPPLPTSYSGTVTVDGGAPPANSVVYAKVVNSRLGDLWSFADVSADGAYNIAVKACESSYQRSSIEFWLNGARAQQTGSFDATGKFTRLDLNFPAVN